MDRFEVVYILLRFPRLTETFVADEIWQLQQQGKQVRIYSLLGAQPGPVQPVARRLAQGTTYTPGPLSLQLWWAQLYFLARSPLLYVRLLAGLMAQPYPQAPLELALRRLVIFSKAVWLAYDLRKSRVALLHAHFAWLSGAAARVVSRLLGVPYTVTAHAYDIFTSNELLPFVANSAAQVVAISHYNKERVLAACPGVDAHSISVIHCGINLDLFAPPARTEAGPRPIEILSVGSLIEKKGHEYLIQACQLLQAKGVDFRCTIIGGGQRQEALQQLIHECGLEGRVILAGPRPRDEVLAAFQRSDVFVLACVVTSYGDQDGIPVALMEAMAMGIPVVSTRVSGIPELVRHRETGWLAPERDAAAVAEGILALTSDPTLRAHVTKNGRALVETEFSLEYNTRRLAALFEAARGPQATGQAVPDPSTPVGV